MHFVFIHHPTPLLSFFFSLIFTHKFPLFLPFFINLPVFASLQSLCAHTVSLYSSSCLFLFPLISLCPFLYFVCLAVSFSWDEKWRKQGAHNSNKITLIDQTSKCPFLCLIVSTKGFFAVALHNKLTCQGIKHFAQPLCFHSPPSATTK